MRFLTSKPVLVGGALFTGAYLGYYAAQTDQVREYQIGDYFVVSNVRFRD